MFGTSALLTTFLPVGSNIVLYITIFLYQCGFDMSYMFLYVDDIIIITSSHDLRKSIMILLASEFSMKDLGLLSYFLGIAMIRHGSDLFLNESTYTSVTIACTNMTSCNPSTTLVDTKQKLSTSSSHRMRIPLCTRVLLVPYNILLSLALTFYMLFNKFFFSCMPFQYGLLFNSTSIEKFISYNDVDYCGCHDIKRFTSGYCW